MGRHLPCGNWMIAAGSRINSNIHNIIMNGLRDGLCRVFMENLDFKYHPEEGDDYVCPDIMVVCDRSHLKGGSYSGVPKFIAETLSPSTAKRDRTVKMDIYEQAGVEEYWIVSPPPGVPWRFIICKMESMCWSRGICSRMIRRRTITMGRRKSA